MNGEPKPKMTFVRATLVLAVSILFDVTRAFFALFIFTGPAITGIIAGAAASHYLGFLGSAGTYLGVLIGTFAAGAAIPLGAALESFGAILAMVVGLFGFGLVILLFFIWGVPLINRILSMLFTFCLSETPLLDAVPVLTPFAWSVVREQQKNDKAELAAYQAKRAAEARKLQEAQARAAQQAYLAGQQAANDAAYAEESAAEEENLAAQEAANDARYALPNAANDTDYGAGEIPDTYAKAA